MRVAQFVSIIFHPLLMTTYLVLLLGVLMPSMLLVRQEHMLTFAGFIFGITFVLPTLNIFLFRQYGLISSLKMESRQERVLPFVLISFLYVITACLFIYQVHWSANFTKLMFIVAALGVAATVGTLISKVSVHSLSWWGAIGIMIPLNDAGDHSLLLPTAALILIAGVVMSARLKLNAHTPREVMMGGVAGFAVGLSGMMILF